MNARHRIVLPLLLFCCCAPISNCAKNDEKQRGAMKFASKAVGLSFLAMGKEKGWNRLILNFQRNDHGQIGPSAEIIRERLAALSQEGKPMGNGQGIASPFRRTLEENADFIQQKLAINHPEEFKSKIVEISEKMEKMIDSNQFVLAEIEKQNKKGKMHDAREMEMLFVFSCFYRNLYERLIKVGLKGNVRLVFKEDHQQEENIDDDGGQQNGVRSEIFLPYWMEYILDHLKREIANKIDGLPSDCLPPCALFQTMKMWKISKELDKCK